MNEEPKLNPILVENESPSKTTLIINQVYGQEQTNRGATPSRKDLGREIGAQEARKNQEAEEAEKTIWFGFGMSGLIGWSVAIPALLGALLGLWIDRRFPGDHSWTLALLTVGLLFGCWNAWHWVDKEDRAMRDEVEDKDE